MKNADTSHDGSLTLSLSGDVMTGRGIDQVLPHSVDPVLFERYVKSARRYVDLATRHSGAIPNDVTFDYVWGDALMVLEKMGPDVSIINLETAVTTSDNYWKKKGIHYRMHPGNTPLLTEAGIDVCVLGNNHILDWGYKGLDETLNTLNKHGISVVGAGMDADSTATPAVIETKNGRLLVFSYADLSAGVPVSWKAGEGSPGVNLLENLRQKGIKQVKGDIESFRREGDLVLVSIHWGGNWGYDVPKLQQKFVHQLIDFGFVDMIHGHSSHHPKGIEVYRDRLVLYGCGDLINDYEGIAGHEEYRGELSLLYFPTLVSLPLNS
ncbi:CapA family protein [Aliifodinibius sp. S!AR15-10]|uniref:CapA family protein n=1 Tax=Aliifodinibius sp. S!AR15-10 TaxID=2950437 RepID=UPI002866DCB1|nr:CapA family protein [Aliifodinibius sp. S!AR15-10]MDR8394405.1 CapA family protein [Aliifodinibius sp. S!AR15-10]